MKTAAVWRDEVVDAAPVPFVFRIERVRRLLRESFGLLLVDVVRRRDRALVAFFDRVPTRADRRRPRDEALDIGTLGTNDVRRDPAELGG